MGGIPMAFGVSLVATRKSPDCPVSKVAFRSARLEIIALVIVVVVNAAVALLVW